MKKSNPFVTFLIFGVMAVGVFSIVRNSQAVRSSMMNYVSAEETFTPSPTHITEVKPDIEIGETIDFSNLLGEVSVINIDEDDPSNRLVGASIQILNIDSGVSYIESIEDDEGLIFSLPLGIYSVTQLTPAEDYKLDSHVYEFSLLIPENTNPESVKAIRADVVLKNKKIEPSIDFLNLNNVAADSEENLITIIPNPVTGDDFLIVNLETLMTVTAFLVSVMFFMISYVVYLKRKINFK